MIAQMSWKGTDEGAGSLGREGGGIGGVGGRGGGMGGGLWFW